MNKVNSNKPKHWSLLAERGSYWGIYFLLKVNQYFGRWLFRLFIWPIVFYFFVTGRTSRRASMTFLQKVYQQPGQTVFADKPGYWQSFKHFISFAESALDKIDGWSGKLQNQDILYHNKDIYDELVKHRRGAVFIGSHLGNLEVCRALNKHSNTRVNVMVFTHHAVEFNRILKKIDPKMDVNLIQVTEVSADLAIRLKQRLDDGEHIVIAADRTSASSFGRVSKVDFLGETACISQGPFILASLMDCPVYMMFCFKANKGANKGFEMMFDTFEQPFQCPRKQRQQMLQQQITRYVERLSFYCLKYPYQWYNFFDFWLDDADVQREQQREQQHQQPEQTKTKNQPDDKLKES